MFYQNRLFLAVVLLVVCGLTCPSIAVPTVKKLGSLTNNNINNASNDILNSKVTPMKLSTPSKTSSSVPGLGLIGKTENKTTSDTKVVNTTQKSEVSVDSARIPGLHGSLIKGISSKLSSNYAPQSNDGGNTSDLTQRIIGLEEEMGTKQEILESGNGISIDGKTISLSEEMVILPERLEEINQEIDDLNKKVNDTGLSENYYTIDQTKDYVQQVVSNIPSNEMVYDSVTKEHKRVTIVDDFDEEYFIDKLRENEQ